MTDRTEIDESLVVSPQEAATMLRVSSRTIQRYVRDGHLPAVRLPGGRITRIRRSDVEKLLTGAKDGAASKAAS